MAKGYGYFLLNAAAGLVVTLALFAAVMHWTSMHYLLARLVVSVIAGFLMFALNATLNFKKI